MPSGPPDLDRFLAAVESKLRGPFAPLELTKTMTTPALRGPGVSIVDYLEQLALVFPRTEKVVQMRILMALAALLLEEEALADENEARIQEVVLDILADAQQRGGGQEEWVPMIAGLIENILFGQASTDTAQSMLQAACDEIIASVQKVLHETATETETEPDDQDAYTAADIRASHLRTADVDPTLAPFRYSLLKPSILQAMDMEGTQHAHFKTNSAAGLLHYDFKMEATKAKEEGSIKKLQVLPSQAPAGQNAAAVEKKAAVSVPFMPGMAAAASKKKASAKTAASKKTNLFMTTKKPALPAKGTLRVKKGGAVKRLVGEGRAIKTVTATAGKFSSKAARDTKASKMKVLDMAEVADLQATKQQQQQQQTAVAPKKGFKRKAALQAAAASPAKLAKTEPATNGQGRAAPPPVNPDANALAAAALSNYQKRVGAAQPPAGRKMGFEDLLEQKSNKLSDEDRQRVQLFFEEKNPTPEQRSYRVKLHEERGNDPTTGEAFKKTYYLDLNYDDWTSTQSAKIKRYSG